jgi:hypothetical protein
MLRRFCHRTKALTIVSLGVMAERMIGPQSALAITQATTGESLLQKKPHIDANVFS